MLKITGEYRKYNVFDTKKGKNILDKEYEHIEIQDHGIVARKEVKGTFLDHRYDLYDLNGKLLFSQTEKYDGNYVTNYHFYIHKNFVKQVISSTPDYDKWSHDTTSWSNYYYLNGEKLNIDNQQISEIFCKNNIGIIDTSNGDEYLYDFNSRKVIFKKSDLINQIEPLANEIIAVENEKFEKMKTEYVLNEKYDIIKKRKLKAKDEIIFNKLCNEALKNKNFDFTEYDNEDLPLSNALNDLWNVWFNVKNARSESGLINWSGFEASGASVDIRKNANINLEYESYWAGWQQVIDEYYTSLKLFELDYKTLKLKVYKNNIGKFKKYYESVTGKKCNLLIDNITIEKPENEEELEK